MVYLYNILTEKDIVIGIGDAVMAATIQFAIAGFEMSSKFSIVHFTTDQEKLNHAANELDYYLLIGIICTFLLSSLFYLKNNMEGFIICLISNVLIMSWIYYSYKLVLDESRKKHGLIFPKLYF
jgi:presenilin-like A22 family membrane protease